MCVCVCVFTPEAINNKWSNLYFPVADLRMAITIDRMYGHGPSTETHYQIQPKETKVRLYDVCSCLCCYKRLLCTVNN